MHEAFYRNIGACRYVKVFRKIHPVGQGAMYSETFYSHGDLKYVVLYDCGTSTAGVWLDKEIDSLPRVDYLFVSHFHHDHVSGMEKIMEEKGLACKIFIPYVAPSQFLLDFVYNAMEAGCDSTSTVFMLRVLPYLSESGHGQENPQFEVVGSNRTVTIELDPGKGIYWCYDILMESHPDSRAEELVGKILGLLRMPLESAGEKFRSPEWYKKLLEALKDRNKMGEIKKLYRKTFPDGHNSYSMIVHSHQCGASSGACCSFSCVPGCIYTGDAELSDNMAHKISDLAPEYIQVPHHGSVKNHNPWIYHGLQHAFISVGEKSRYHHPSQKVLDDIKNTGAYVHLITESSDAYVEEYVIV